MEFRVRAPGGGRRVGVLAGSFHPVTAAHLALAEAALRHVDHVVLAMPRELPHKRYGEVGMEDRLSLVEQAAGDRFAVAVTDGGLFLEIARECRAALGADCDPWMICGRDAAERIVDWDYGRGPGIVEQMREYGLLVADRDGRYWPPRAIVGRVERLDVAEEMTRISATQVRERLAAGEAWEHLVPAAAVEGVRRLYLTRP